MRPDLTDITILLDRSGSMDCVRDATIEAVNGFVATQKAEPGECRLTLAQFDNLYQIDHASVPIQSVPPLDYDTYQPRGSTALLDAIGRTILENGQRFAAMNESDRPGTVVFVIQTDGLENSSREFNLARINDLIAEHRDKYSWQFVFLGANQDAIASAAALGVAATHAMGYSHSTEGTNAAFVATAKATSRLRKSRAEAHPASPPVDFDFTDEERRDVADAD